MDDNYFFIAQGYFFCTLAFYHRGTSPIKSLGRFWSRIYYKGLRVMDTPGVVYVQTWVGLIELTPFQWHQEKKIYSLYMSGSPSRPYIAPPPLSSTHPKLSVTPKTGCSKRKKYSKRSLKNDFSSLQGNLCNSPPLQLYFGYISRLLWFEKI